MEWNGQYRLSDAIEMYHPNLSWSKAYKFSIRLGYTYAFEGSWLEDCYIRWIRSIGDDICIRHRAPGDVVCYHGERFSLNRLSRVSNLTTYENK